jgi:phosphoadenosine phosphosulfate reductase
MLDAKRIKELEEMIEKSKEIYREAFKKFNVKDIRLVWSGGKDSTLAVWICKELCDEENLPMPKAFTIDEFDTFDEIDEFLKKYSNKWNIELDWGRNDDVLKAANYKLNADVKASELNERNQAEMKRIGFDIPVFPFEAESYIGNHLMKTVVFNTYLEENNVKAVMQGLRWDEQPARGNDPYFEDANADDFTPAHCRFRPILHFKERDLWDATLYFNIPYCELYKQGYRSLGAKTTSSKFCDDPAWEQDLENTVERAGRRQDKEAAMERLRKLGYM